MHLNFENKIYVELKLFFKRTTKPLKWALVYVVVLKSTSSFPKIDALWQYPHRSPPRLLDLNTSWMGESMN